MIIVRESTTGRGMEAYGGEAMSDDVEQPWTEDECEKLCGHCWEKLVGTYPLQRRCRHCNRKEEHVWVYAGNIGKVTP